MRHHLALLLAPLLSFATAAAGFAEAQPGRDITERQPCTYSPKVSADNPQPEFESFADCAVREGDVIQLAAKHLAAVDFDANGLGTILITGQWFLLHSDGTQLPVIAWDNGPDELSEGLVRTVQDGKIAYADKTFQLVVPPRYDWGWPFQDGRALVCLGCRKERAPGEEHTSVVGGTWGFIDREGNEIVPVKYSRELAYDALEKRQAQRPDKAADM